MRRTLQYTTRNTAARPTAPLIGAAALLVGFAARASGPAAAVTGTTQALPPLPLLGMELVCGVLLLDRYADRRRRNRPWSSLFDSLGLGVLMTAGSLFFWGLPRATGFVALFEKFATGLVALSFPLLLVALIIQLCRTQACSRAFTWFLGLTFCLLASVNLLFIGALLSCLSSGNCP